MKKIHSINVEQVLLSVLFLACTALAATAMIGLIIPHDASVQLAQTAHAATGHLAAAAHASTVA